MLCMFSLILGIYQDIIDEHDDKLVKIGHEYLVHEVHEYCWGICQPKRYY
jgi:hypothetical protein